MPLRRPIRPPNTCEHDRGARPPTPTSASYPRVSTSDPRRSLRLPLGPKACAQSERTSRTRCMAATARGRRRAAARAVTRSGLCREFDLSRQRWAAVARRYGAVDDARTASSIWVGASGDLTSPCKIATPFSTVTLTRELWAASSSGRMVDRMRSARTESSTVVLGVSPDLLDDRQGPSSCSRCRRRYLLAVLGARRPSQPPMAATDTPAAQHPVCASQVTSSTLRLRFGVRLYQAQSLTVGLRHGRSAPPESRQYREPLPRGVIIGEHRFKQVDPMFPIRRDRRRRAGGARWTRRCRAGWPYPCVAQGRSTVPFPKSPGDAGGGSPQTNVRAERVRSPVPSRVNGWTRTS